MLVIVPPAVAQVQPPQKCVVLVNHDYFFVVRPEENSGASVSGMPKHLVVINKISWVLIRTAGNLVYLDVLVFGHQHQLGVHAIQRERLFHLLKQHHKNFHTFLLQFFLKYEYHYNLLFYFGKIFVRLFARAFCPACRCDPCLLAF